MDNPLAVMGLALRVLTAISEDGEPEVPDKEQLRRLVPDYDACPVDELACEVVRQASARLQRKQAGRQFVTWPKQATR